MSRLSTRIVRDERTSGTAVGMRARSVHFAANPRMQLPVTPTSRFVSPLLPPDALPEIADLCSAMSGPNLDDRWLGRLVDQHVSDEYCVFVSRCPMQTSTRRHFVSLGALLTAPLLTPDRKVRFGIAMALVSSHLQLHCSPWLEPGWTNTDIYFAMEKGSHNYNNPI